MADKQQVAQKRNQFCEAGRDITNATSLHDNGLLAMLGGFSTSVIAFGGGMAMAETAIAITATGVLAGGALVAAIAVPVAMIAYDHYRDKSADPPAVAPKGMSCTEYFLKQANVELARGDELGAIRSAVKKYPDVAKALDVSRPPSNDSNDIRIATGYNKSGPLSYTLVAPPTLELTR
jgi:hypothetical protein